MSDLLIKGMKMPKNCGCCPLAVGGRFTFTCMRLIGKEFSYELAEQRQEDCPLKELPELHGDLIDRDKLAAAFEKYEIEEASVFDLLFDAPTVIEASEE